MKQGLHSSPDEMRGSVPYPEIGLPSVVDRENESRDILSDLPRYDATRCGNVCLRGFVARFSHCGAFWMRVVLASGI